jgi:CheY-like chemotaxis protein
MEGDLTLEYSEVGKGSVFRLTLPYRQGIIETSLEDYSILVGKKCLVVEDNENNRVHIAKILDEFGILYTLANSGHEALLIYGTEDKLDKFDYYIIDIRMPHMNGNILIEKLLKIKYKPCISLNSGIDAPSKLFNINLQKPIISKKLLKALLTFKIITKSGSNEFVPSVQTPKGVEILIAEDNKINQDVIKRVLHSLNYNNFKIVPDGLKAYQEYQENPNKYNIILLDIRMPVLNGLEAAKLILSYYESNKDRFKKPIIVGLSANCMSDDKKMCLDNGMSDYLIKPIEISTLQECLQKYVPF